MAQEVIATLASSLHNVRPFLSLVPQVEGLGVEDFLVVVEHAFVDSGGQAVAMRWNFVDGWEKIQTGHVMPCYVTSCHFMSLSSTGATKSMRVATEVASKSCVN